jgi:hypothetical protein
VQHGNRASLVRTVIMEEIWDYRPGGIFQAFEYSKAWKQYKG